MEYLSIFFLISLAYFPQGQQHKSLTPELSLSVPANSEPHSLHEQHSAHEPRPFCQLKYAC